MNAAKLDHPFRTIEAVFNDAQIDCIDSFEPASTDALQEETCLQECLNKTEKVRSDLRPFLSSMLLDRYMYYGEECLEFDKLWSGVRFIDAVEEMRQELSELVCKNEYLSHQWSGHVSLKTVHECSYNRTEIYDYLAILDEMMTNTFRIPKCLEKETFEKFQNDCIAQSNGMANDYEDKSCDDLIDDLSVDLSVFCHAFAVLKIIGTQNHIVPFRSGILLKYAQRSDIHIDLSMLYNFTSNILFMGIDRNLLNCLLNEPQVEHSSQLGGLENCQSFLQADWSSNIGLLYKFKRQTIAPTSKVVNEKSEIEDVKRLKYVLQNKYGYEMYNKSIVNDYASILACKFGDTEISRTCDIFSNTFSSVGIGYTFNPQPFWTLFKNNTSNYAFHKELYEKEESFDNDLPRKIINAGQAFSLHFIIRHNPYGYEFTGQDDAFWNSREDVFLAIHDPKHIPNLRSEGLRIEPGMSYEIRIQPMVTITDESALALDIKTRNCLSIDESDELSSFNYYSQSACIFECKLRQAINACNCSAWNYPMVDPSASICFGTDSNYCFNKFMDRNTIEETCNCLNDCEYITYDVDVQVFAIRGMGETSGNFEAAAWAYSFDHYKYWNGIRFPFVEEKYPHNKEISIVQISVQRPLATKITRSARVSFSSQVANLGGIIGLFTGMSILSLAESAYWLMKYIKHLILPM